MNNCRDCPHGRQIGKCSDCEVDQLSIEIEALKAENAILRGDLDSVITQAWQKLWEVARQGTAIERQRDELRDELDKATRALTSAGYTLLEGAQEWKPPIGPSSAPLLDLIDALRAELEVKQNGI